MAIATHCVASGVLSKAIWNSRLFSVISNSSDVFETLAGSTMEDANQLTVTVAIDEIVAPSSPNNSEELIVELYQSAEGQVWTYQQSLLTVSSGPGNYKATFGYVGETDNYFRIQFNIDEPIAPGPLPYPSNQETFDGSCWVSAWHA